LIKLVYLWSMWYAQVSVRLWYHINGILKWSIENARQQSNQRRYEWYAAPCEFPEPLSHRSNLPCDKLTVIQLLLFSASRNLIVNSTRQRNRQLYDWMWNNYMSKVLTLIKNCSRCSWNLSLYNSFGQFCFSNFYSIAFVFFSTRKS